MLKMPLENTKVTVQLRLMCDFYQRLIVNKIVFASKTKENRCNYVVLKKEYLIEDNLSMLKIFNYSDVYKIKKFIKFLNVYQKKSISQNDIRKCIFK